MLERINFKEKSIKKSAYKEERDALMSKLINLQQKAREEELGVVVLFEGWDGAGKGSRISDILYMMDARSTNVVHTEKPNINDISLFADLDKTVTGYNPFMKEFWEGLGERGTVTFYEKGWYTVAQRYALGIVREVWRMEARHHTTMPRIPIKELGDRAFKPTDKLGGVALMDIFLDSVSSWERSLTDNGYIVVKFFVHIDRQTQRDRLEGLFENPETRWRVNDEELLMCSEYKSLYKIYDEILERTNYDYAPWHVVNGNDKRGSNLQIARTLVDAIEKGLAAKAEKAQQPPLEVAAPIMSRFPICTDYPNLDNVDHGLILGYEDYKAQLKAEQKRLFELELKMYQQRVPMMVMYEGWDAAGKGGAIKRVAQSLDARAYKIYPSPAPTKVELAHPHLWRYWTRLPKAGHVGIYDRSWYGRVLVERLEGFATPEEWARSYDEINEFERDLTDWGAILIKFWVDIHPDEQLKRFREREENPEKQWKITPDDWRNRDKFPQYYEAVQDMFRLTSTTYAPWTILESDNKPYARVKSLRTINDALEKRLDL